jgi:hypothetical protein
MIYSGLATSVCVNGRDLFFGPPLWSSGQRYWLQIQRSGFDSPVLPDFLRYSGSGTESTQSREYN